MRKFIRIGLFTLAVLAQLAVPTWMLVKHHLILTQGEKVSLTVTTYDPSDLFMGRYVRLNPLDELPPILEGVDRHYLRYYCDERYATVLDSAMGRRNEFVAQLDVRVWKGEALAEMLWINGQPAYDYVAEHQDQEGCVVPREIKRRVLRFPAIFPVLPEDTKLGQELREHDCDAVALPIPQEILQEAAIPPREIVSLKEVLLQQVMPYWVAIPLFAGDPEAPFDEPAAKAYYERLAKVISSWLDNYLIFTGSLPEAHREAHLKVLKQVYKEARVWEDATFLEAHPLRIEPPEKPLQEMLEAYDAIPRTDACRMLAWEAVKTWQRSPTPETRDIAVKALTHLLALGLNAYWENIASYADYARMVDALRSLPPPEVPQELWEAALKPFTERIAPEKVNLSPKAHRAIAERLLALPQSQEPTKGETL